MISLEPIILLTELTYPKVKDDFYKSSNNISRMTHMMMKGFDTNNLHDHSVEKFFSQISKENQGIVFDFVMGKIDNVELDDRIDLIERMHDCVDEEVLHYNDRSSKCDEKLKEANREKLEKDGKEFLLNSPRLDFIGYEDIIVSLVNEICEKCHYRYMYTDSDFLSMLYQMSNDNPDYFKFNQALKSSVQKPNMDQYEEYITNFSTMSREKFDDFITDIKRTKESEGRIPEKYCDYLIQQKIIEDSPLNENLDEYFQCLKRAFEDKGRWILEKKGITNCTVVMDDNMSNNIHGSCYMGEKSSGGQLIKYNENVLYNLTSKNVHAINTLFHEIAHAEQNKHINIDKEFHTVDEYKMYVESAVESSIRDFYETNYIGNYMEIDARVEGLAGEYMYLEQLGFSTKEIIDAGLNTDSKPLSECYDYTFMNEQNVYDKVEEKGKIDENNNLNSLQNITGRLIKEKPEIIQYYPLLSIAFDKDGNKVLDFGKMTLDDINRRQQEIAIEEDEKNKEINSMKQNYSEVSPLDRSVAISAMQDMIRNPNKDISIEKQQENDVLEK